MECKMAASVLSKMALGVMKQVALRCGMQDDVTRKAEIKGGENGA